MQKRLLLTRSRHDIGNQYLYEYCEEVLKDAESLGWKADSVENEKNNGRELQSRLSKTNPDFIFFNGHGNDGAVFGHKNEALVDSASAHVLGNRVVFARSCSALNLLGKEAVKKGCRAFIGYAGQFLIPRTNEYESTPLRDKTARPVLEVSNLVGKLLLKGDTVGQAVDAAQQKAADLMLKMLASQEPYDAATFRALHQNYSVLSFVGDPDAKA